MSEAGRDAAPRDESDEELDDEFDDDEDLDDEDLDEDVDDEDEDEDDGVDPNRVAGATARTVLEYLVRAVVDDPEAVEVDVHERRTRGRPGVALEVRVAPSDMGRVIGKRGRIAGAIRTVVRAAAVRDGVEVDVDFLD